MIIATAGHVDHGKTLLVKALTGTDTDRLPEEKKRNLTIDLGFAYLPAGDEITIGFIDVPGHERFVRNALCGLAGTDFVLFIIAADDGPMPQSLEHLAIVDLLGIRRGAVALTKIDRVSEQRLSEVKDEVSSLISGTTLEGAPVYPVSAMSGDGIENLGAHLQQAARNTPERSAGNNFRLAVDRRFRHFRRGPHRDRDSVLRRCQPCRQCPDVLGADMTLRVPRYPCPERAIGTPAGRVNAVHSILPARNCARTGSRVATGSSAAMSRHQCASWMVNFAFSPTRRGRSIIGRRCTSISPRQKRPAGSRFWNRRSIAPGAIQPGAVGARQSDRCGIRRSFHCQGSVGATNHRRWPGDRRLYSGPRSRETRPTELAQSHVRGCIMRPPSPDCWTLRRLVSSSVALPRTAI